MRLRDELKSIVQAVQDLYGLPNNKPEVKTNESPNGSKESSVKR